MEVIPDGPSLFWNSEANMQSFELFWEMNLHEWCASPEVQGIWKTVNQIWDIVYIPFDPQVNHKVRCRN